MIEVTVDVDLAPLKRFEAALDRDLRANGSGPIRAAIRQWGARFRAFIQERFVRMSRGGWPPLKRRRRRGKGGSVAILRDTGTMFNALTPVFASKPGAIQKDIPFGVRVGYGGPARHPKGKASIHDIARFHQTGAGPLVKREIIVGPDQRTLDLMAADMDRGIDRMLSQTGNH